MAAILRNHFAQRMRRAILEILVAPRGFAKLTPARFREADSVF
jgi:hypothetical protein